MNASSQGNLHEQVQELLPWYVNDTLDEAGRDRVSLHLDDCEVCRDDVAVLSAAQRVLLTNEVEPIVPAISASELLATQAGRSQLQQNSNKWFVPLVAAAASIVVVVLAMQMLGPPTGDENRTFKTATSAGADTQIEYVLRLDFEAGVADEDRLALVNELEGMSSWSVDETQGYVVHLRMSNPTLTKLEDIEAMVRSNPRVRSAKFVAMQVPVR